MKQSTIREYIDADRLFVTMSFLRGFSQGYVGEDIRHAHSDAFYKCHQPVVDRILSRSKVRLVACDPEHPEILQAYVFADKRADNVPIIHFINVKKDFRGLGLARELYVRALSDLGFDAQPSVVIASHRSYMYDSLCKKFTQLRYDPYSILVV